MPRDAILSHAGPRVLVCPVAFKGSLSAVDAAAAMAAGILGAMAGAEAVRLPLADGGDGSLDVLATAGFDRVPVTTRGPTGLPVASSFARRGRTVVVELAAACGLTLLPDGRPDPMGSSTLGLGDAVAAALDAEVDDLVICLGGSASTDGGAGLLVALGAALVGADGLAVPPCGGQLARVAALDLSGLDPRLRRVRVTVATDVLSPLLGPGGAAAVFAPQKGASDAQVLELEGGLEHWAAILADATAIDASTLAGAGAAGGTGVAAIAALGGTVVSGAAYLQDLIGLPVAINACDVVVTGEGALDRQTLLGKGVGRVAAMAAARGVPVVAVCGKVGLSGADLQAAGIAIAVGLTDVAPPGADVMADAAALVRDAAEVALLRWCEA